MIKYILIVLINFSISFLCHCSHENKIDTNSLSCKASMNLENYLNDLIINPKNYLHNSRKCIYTLLDSLVRKANTHKQDSLYYSALYRISEFSDGEISEQMVYLIGTLFNSDFDDFATFLYGLSLVKPNNNFLLFYKESLCIKISDANNPSLERKKIRLKINGIRNSKPEIWKFMTKIERNLDLSICD